LCEGWGWFPEKHKCSARIVDVHSRDELGELAGAFNTMAARVSEAQRELEQKVQERTAQLEGANKELEAFSYSVSHDLRAPLRGIDGFSQALLEDYSDKIDEQGKHFLNRVRSTAQRMAELAPRVRDREGEIKFHSSILPVYLRRTRSIEELLP
jgi:light-regulated signal transduction histidine kinase (bacteriophytochrome)